MDANQIVAEMDAAFQAAGDPDRAGYMKSYLKSDLDFHGVDTSGIRRQTAAFASSHPDLTRDDVTSLARACWDRPVYELRTFAVGLLSRFSQVLAPADLGLVEDLLRESSNWAHVDGLATGVGARLVEQHSGTGDVLDRWAQDDYFWVRRAAMLALLPPLDRGEGDLDRFLRYADRMLDEKEFFIRKAIGWVLRDASKPNPEPVYDFVKARIDRISGVTIREAVKYLSDAQGDELMAAYKARPPARIRGGS